MTIENLSRPSTIDLMREKMKSMQDGVTPRSIKIQEEQFSDKTSALPKVLRMSESFTSRAGLDEEYLSVVSLE